VPAEPVALVTEFQTEPAGDMLDRLNEYIARLRRELRAGGFRVLGALVNLTGPTQPDTLEMVLPGRPEVGLRLRVVQKTLREEDSAATLAAVAAGRWGRCLLPWIPLMGGGGESSVPAEWKQLAEAEPDDRLRAEYGSLAKVFARLTDHYDAWADLLKEWEMKKSPVVEEWRMEGELAASRAKLLRALELRFRVALPPELVAAIEASTDYDELSRWFDAVFATDTLDAFRAAIGR
jgi:hypothetical protein